MLKYFEDTDKKKGAVMSHERVIRIYIIAMSLLLVVSGLIIGFVAAR